jgi:hypothetical protein
MGSRQATAIPNPSAVPVGSIRTTCPAPVILTGRDVDSPGTVRVNSTGLRYGIKQGDSRSKPQWLMFLVTASASAIASPEGNFTWASHSMLKRRNLRSRRDTWTLKLAFLRDFFVRDFFWAITTSNVKFPMLGAPNSETTAILISPDDGIYIVHYLGQIAHPPQVNNLFAHRHGIPVYGNPLAQID